MKKLIVLFLFLVIVCESWSVPKPMESIKNYNVMMVHGAYGPYDDDGNLQGFEPGTYIQAVDTNGRLGAATMGKYTSDNRITRWISHSILEEPKWENDSIYVRNSCVYNWRAFSNTRNSSKNNAVELGNRTWNKDKRFGSRRALIEEAQEVKAAVFDSTERKYIYGQEALDSIRKNPDLFRQLASRYILVGHSMGGVVSREWIQNSDYYHGEVDKVITLDSPHEGTGALNMQLNMQWSNYLDNNALEGLTTSGFAIAGVATAAWLMGKDLGILQVAGIGLGISLALETIQQGFGSLIELGLQDYESSDSLVCYVDPEMALNSFCNGTEPSINALKTKSYVSDSMPMFRLLAGENSMVFTDPNLGVRRILSFMVPDALTVPFANLWEQFSGGGSVGANFTNSVTGVFAGLLAGANVQGHGTSLVETSIGLGFGTKLLTDPSVDVKRATFNAAFHATESDFLSRLVSVSLITGVTAALALDALIYLPSSAPLKVGVGWATGLSLAPSVVSAIFAGIWDLKESHNMPLMWEHQNTWRQSGDVDGAVWGKGNKFTSIGSAPSVYDPYLMEDFLYERPFVNLALSDSRTMDSLARNSSASLNPNCYFESDSLQKVPLCEVGLYGSRDSIVVDTVKKDTTHIYNAVAERLDSIGNVVRDSSGKVVYDSVYYGTFEQRNYAEFRNSPLRFKSESDWYKVGVKVDRWERVDGLKPNGDLAPKGVPIRHVERYNVPDIVATGFIEKYSFVVDDLMPHRMRQIKMTFNSNEEVAWECDISKAEDDPHACAVYKRLLGDAWKPIFVKDTVVVMDSTGKPKKEIIDVAMKVPHPIKKNGRFDFDARKYFGNLASIQKDNQNTVMISMVNKIGLSNTQRFYYLFKATDNMLKPTWPQHDVVLNAIDGFKAYVSALDYQGFRVHGASDEFFRDSLGNYVEKFSSRVMDTAIAIGNNGSEYVFASKRKDLNPAEGEYRWVVSTNINNKDLKKPSEPDSSKTDSYEVHFKVDRTAPAFTLTSDAMMNPDSSMFITRFKWAGKDSADNAKGSDIRAMRWTLEKATGQPSGGSHATFTKYAELPALYDVASNEFAIAWDKVPQSKRDSMESGLYRIAAHAIDYAVPNENAYHAMNALVDGIFSNPQDTSVWGGIDSLRLNDTTIYAEFRVDHSAPSFTFRETRAVTASDTMNYGTYVNLSGKYDALRANRPARDIDWTYVSKDSLLQIGYTVMDSLNGLDSAAVTVGWNFVHIPDTNVIDRAGDSVWVFDSLGGKSSGTWTEMAGLRMADGEYSVRAILRDEAKNVRQDFVPKRVRVDRTAPQIIGLTSDHLVYMDKDGDFSATILLSENADIGVNRTGMHCSYRVLGGADSSWHEIRKGERKLLANDTVNFTIAKTSVDTARGTRYLEAACVDAAGNVSIRTDLFHVGARFPQITYPQPDTIQSEQSFIPIVGIAPKTSSADSLSSVYRLRYRIDNDTTWRTDKVRVVAANRSTSVDNVSRISQSTEGVLGYLENDGFGGEAKITVELAIASCETCDDWAATTTNFVVIPPDTNYSKPAVEFAITRNGSDVTTFKTDDGPVDISVRLKNKFNGNYMLRVYAEDSKHRGIFDASREKVFYNPYYGTPTATSPDTGIWFYELDGKYHLAWKNLDKINLKVGYNSAKFGETCKSADANQSLADGCSTELSPIDFSSIANAANAYLADYPEWMPPAYIDSTMTITKDSGEVVLESSEAFRVYVERKDATDTAALNIPVYFGESTKPGFYWVKHVDSLVSPLMTGWTVNPNAYGLDYRWNGIATSGAYPSGDITLYAEVTENILDNPFVNIDSKTLKVEQKKAELVVRDTLPDYVLLMKAASGTSSAGTSDTPVYELDSMKVYFGLKNGDAHVKISVLDSSKKPFRTLLDSILSAHTGDSAYSVIWDGKDSLGNVQSVGTYYIKFESPSNAFKAKTVPFEMKLRNGLLDETPKDPKTSNLGFYVAEAKKVADDVYRYEPYADYLVLANMSGWYLPDSLRNRTYNVNGTVSGTQNILGFRPERFSLGIKRHRDTLDLFILVRVHAQTVAAYDCDHWYAGHRCKFSDEPRNEYAIFEKRFTEKTLSFDSSFSMSFPERGIHDFEHGLTDIDIVACSRKMWNDVFVGFGENSSTTFLNAMKKCEWNLRNIFGRDRMYLRDPGNCANSATNYEFKTDFYDTKALDDGCEPVENDGYLESVCEYPKKEGYDSDRYDPNRKLFNVTLIPAKNGRFFGNCKNINDYNEDDVYWTSVDFGLNLTIPESYWNAPFGMDNLVNRTIRFDHTNETIFNEKGKDGYWNSVVKDGNNGNPVNSGVKNYYDGSEWRFNPAYGLITPYEVQRLIFFPVDVYSDGSNVFRFDDEGIVKDTVAFGYSSSFELKFYGHDTTTHHFEAKVIGNLTDPSSNSGCEVDTAKFVMQIGAKNPCQVRVTSEGQGPVKTPTFTHGNVHFFVGMNRLWSENDTKNGMSIPYPADSATWRKSIGNICSDSASYTYFKKMAQGDKDSACYKYYGSGSKVHFYFNDYGNNDSL